MRSPCRGSDLRITLGKNEDAVVWLNPAGGRSPFALQAASQEGRRGSAEASG